MSAKKKTKDWSPIDTKEQGIDAPSGEGDFLNTSEREELGILNFFNVVEPEASITDAKEEKARVDHKYHLNLFYQIKNLNSFYKTARSYLADYNRGVRSFAIACEHADQRPSLNALALASFFQNKIEGLRVFILAPRIVLESYDHECQVERISADGCGADINLYHYGPSMTAISIEELSQVNERLDNLKEFFEIMKVLVSRYDVSFWSLPHYNQLKDMKKFLFILTNFVQNVSIVIRRGKTTQKGLRDLKRFFQNYNVPVKGVLVEGL